MKKILVALFLFASITSVAQDPNFHIYLCFGQSNMQGSAPIEAVDSIPVERFLTMAPNDFKDKSRELGKWYPAIPPLSHNQAALSPADYFGRNMVANLPDSITIGVINVAVSGCDIRLFDKEIYIPYMQTYPQDWFQNLVNALGGCPYGRMVHLCKMAQREGVIKGFLLHQGETNTGDKEWPNYVKSVYDDLLADLGLNAEDVPLLAGEVVHENLNGKCSKMNPIIRTLPETIPTAHVISSEGCSTQDDLVHFDSEGVRELGKHYAEKMLLLNYKK